MIAKLNHESTPDSPLRYFEYFFLKEGFKVFRYAFYEESQLIHEVVFDVNKEEEYIEVGNGNCEGIGIQRIYFSEELEKQLNFQKRKSFYLLIQVIDTFSEDKQIVLYLKKLLGSLHFISNQILKSSNIKYPQSLDSIYSLTTNIYEKYSLFLEGIQPAVVTEAYKFLSREKLPDVVNKFQKANSNISSKTNELETPIVTFKWKKDRIQYFFNFLELLLRENYIQHDSVTQDNFLLAFNGTSITTHLGIKWKLPQKEKGSISSLIRVVKLLMEELHLIDEIENKSLLAKMLSAIFLDSKGEKIENLDVLVNQHSKGSNNILEIALIKEIRSWMV